MTGELTIFDMGVPEVKVVKEEKVTTKKNVSKPAPMPKEELKVTDEWTIHFATESFNMTDFVDEIPEEGITLETLRIEMEKVFFQFTASRTKWDIDKENKRLFPDATGAAKGAFECL